MTLQQLQDSCEAMLDSFEPFVHAAQRNYLQARRNFCQLPSPMDATPIDGALANCDWSRFVADVGVAWDASSIGSMLPPQLPCNVWCHVARDVNGPLYTIGLEINHGGAYYRHLRVYRDSGRVVSTPGWAEVQYDA